MSAMDKPPVAVIAGVGEGLGFALGKRFSRAGYKVALAARSAELFYQIHAQPRTAWTFEANVRPWAEKF